MGRTIAMAKLVVLLAIALLAISMADSGYKVRISSLKVLAKEIEHSEGENMLTSNGQGTLQTYQCPSQCSRRCSKTQYHKPCMFFCQKCCIKCLCVPSGFYGNKGECPCYNNWKTKRGGPKCP
ncbi:Gibberellin regulated protein [Musa troglodytarum]|uniref:Gibberellin regulated protein n=1 Tax=Musa troglodytarum TaxID=320322 RepID=A0A9E7GLN0_9LILI|nr:Gibberellin regulated protein [Musa troglodytarum]